MPGGTDPNPSRRKPWNGVPVAFLSATAQLFLRCRHRHHEEEENGYRTSDPEVRCGYLLARLHQHLVESKDVPNVPTKAALAERIKVSPGTFGKFLVGEPSNREAWVRHSRDLVAYLLVGDAADEERKPILDRFLDYYFRESDRVQQSRPAYFHTARQRFAEPCSRAELSGEVTWLVHEYLGAKHSTKFLWVSGESSFFPEGVCGRMGEAVKFAIGSGVRPTFVYPRNTPAAESVAEFLADWGFPPGEMNREIDFADAKLPDYWWEFLNPAIQFLFLGVATPGGDRDETLFVLRGSEGDEKVRNRHGAVALWANPAEFKAFKKWAERMGL
jgi:hypothetical protein